MLEVSGRNRDETGDTQRQYTSTGTVDTNTREIEVPGVNLEKEGVGPCQTLARIVSRLVGKLGCVKSCALVNNRGQLLCKELSSRARLP